jgi:hypothetical protein
MTERSTMRQAELRSERGFIRKQLEKPDLPDTVRFMWERRLQVVEVEMIGDGERGNDHG